MKEQKHIDRVFQERFKDFEAIPKDTVWKNIEAQLTKKAKKDRTVPIWWRYAGMAALLLLLLTIGGVFFNSKTTPVPANQVVDAENDNPSSPLNQNDLTDPKKEIKGAVEDGIGTNAATPNQSNQDSPFIEDSPVSSTIANNTSHAQSAHSAISNKTGPNIPISTQKVADNKPDAAAITSEEKGEAPSSVDMFQNESKAPVEKEAGIKNNNQQIANTKDIPRDSVAIVKPDENKSLTIEDALAEASNTLDAEEAHFGKWRIAPNAAPVYFNSLGKGSSIDPQFNDNAKRGEINMSYGVLASYAITKNLKIRSGVNKVTLGYNTNNVVVYETVGSRSSSSLIKNIDSDATSGNLSLISGESLGDFKNETFISTSNTSINQSFGYIEVPLEIEYALINKKLGVNVIGGFSSFFLNNNKLYSYFEGDRTFIGEATNINKVSYSANFGLGLNYKMTKKVEFNLEPVFKYQINTFNNTSGNFKPFFIGVYTGIGFKF